MNKKGVIRVIEATIAVLIVIGTLLIIVSKQGVQTEEDKSESMREVLNEIAKNVTLRERIMEDDAASNAAENALMIILKQNIVNLKFYFNVSICDAYEGSCGGAGSYPSNAKEIFTEERIITASPAKFTPKIVKIYMWE